MTSEKVKGSRKDKDEKKGAGKKLEGERRGRSGWQSSTCVRIKMRLGVERLLSFCLLLSTLPSFFFLCPKPLWITHSASSPHFHSLLCTHSCSIFHAPFTLSVLCPLRLLLEIFFWSPSSTLFWSIQKCYSTLYLFFSAHPTRFDPMDQSCCKNTKCVFVLIFFFLQTFIALRKKKKKKFLTLFSPSLQAVFIWNYSTTAGWNTLEFGSFSPLEVVITAVFILTVLKCCCTGLQLCLTYYNILVQPLKAKISATENSKNPINCEYSFSSPKWK